MAAMDMDGDWNVFIDDLLVEESETHEPSETQPAADGDGWDDLMQELVPEGATQSAPSVQIHQSEHNFSVSMFGNVQEVANIGCTLQSQLFSAFQKSFAPAKRSSSDGGKHSTLCSEVVGNTRLLSVAALADKLNVPPTTAGRMITELACALVYGACFLIGCLFSAMCRMFSKHRRYKAVAVINVVKYDETPLKLGVNEWKSFVGRVAPLHVQKKRRMMRQGSQQTEVYCHTKVLAIDWRYGTLACIACYFPISCMALFSQTLLTIELRRSSN